MDGVVSFVGEPYCFAEPDAVPGYFDGAMSEALSELGSLRPLVCRIISTNCGVAPTNPGDDTSPTTFTRLASGPEQHGLRACVVHREPGPGLQRIVSATPVTGSCTVIPHKTVSQVT